MVCLPRIWPKFTRDPRIWTWAAVQPANLVLPGWAVVAVAAGGRVVLVPGITGARIVPSVTAMTVVPAHQVMNTPLIPIQSALPTD